MTHSTNHQHQFAPPAPSSGVCAKGGRRLSSLASAATLNNPEQNPSLPAGGRSLMGGCAAWRHTRAQGGTRVLFIYRAIRPTRLQHQIDNHSRGGAPRWGCCGYRLAVGETGRFGGLGCHRGGCFIPAVDGYDCLLQNWPGLRSRRSLNLRGIEAGSSHLVAIIHHRRKGVLKRSSERHPSHLSKAFRKSGSDEDHRRAEGFGRVGTEYGAQRNVFVG